MRTGTGPAPQLCVARSRSQALWVGPVAEGALEGIREGLFQNKVLHNCQRGGCLFPVSKRPPLSICEPVLGVRPVTACVPMV